MVYSIGDVKALAAFLRTTIALEKLGKDRVTTYGYFCALCIHSCTPENTLDNMQEDFSRIMAIVKDSCVDKSNLAMVG